MEKLYITEEIASHEANRHLGLVVGSEVEIGTKEDCPPAGTKDPIGPGSWVWLNGNCVWKPA